MGVACAGPLTHGFSTDLHSPNLRYSSCPLTSILTICPAIFLPLNLEAKPAYRPALILPWSASSQFCLTEPYFPNEQGSAPEAQTPFVCLNPRLTVSCL